MKNLNWYFVRKQFSNALDIPGHRSRTYFMGNTCELSIFGVSGSWCPGVNVYYGDNGYTMFEFIAYEPMLHKCITLRPDVFERFLSEMNIEGYVNNNVICNKDLYSISYVNVFGRGLAKARRVVWNSSRKLNLSNICDSLINTIVLRYGPNVVYACNFPNCIGDINSTNEVIIAKSDYTSSSWTIESKYFEKEKNAQILLIKSCQDEIIGRRNELDAICERAARSLNILNEKYGIELNIDN